MNAAEHIIEQLLRAQRAAFASLLQEAGELDAVWRAVAQTRAEMNAAVAARCEQLDKAELVDLQARLLAQSDALVCAAVAAAVERQTARLTELAQRDAVTGIGNRAAFDARLREEMARARRYGRPLALALLDIDDFKSINDRGGHPAGDRLLASLAHTLQSSLRATDAIFRYGGDEFAVLSPETAAAADLAAALRRAERERQASPALGAEVTISFGVAAFPHDATEETSLLDIADERLYAEKRARHTDGNR